MTKWSPCNQVWRQWIEGGTRLHFQTTYKSISMYSGSIKKHTDALDQDWVRFFLFFFRNDRVSSFPSSTCFSLSTEEAKILLIAEFYYHRVRSFYFSNLFSFLLHRCTLKKKTRLPTGLCASTFEVTFAEAGLGRAGFNSPWYIGSLFKVGSGFCGRQQRRGLSPYTRGLSIYQSAYQTCVDLGLPLNELFVFWPLWEPP